MKRAICILTLALFACSGCAIFEAGAKAGADIAFTAIKAELPGLMSGILDEAQKMANKGIEEATLAAAKKTEELGAQSLLFVVRSAGLNPADFDFDGDGKFSEAEEVAMLAEVENKRGSLPWWLEFLAATGGLGAGFTLLKSARRYANGKIANGNATT